MRRQVVICVALTLSMSTAVAAFQAPQIPIRPLPQVPGGFVFSEKDVRLGDVVAQGARNDGGPCVYPTVMVRTLAPEPGLTRSVVLATDNDCRLIVDRKETRPITVFDIQPQLRLRGNRAGLTEPSRKAPGITPAPLALRPQLLKTRMSKAIRPRLLPAAMQQQYKQVHSSTAMIGFGGEFDTLTHAFGMMFFSYDEERATVITQVQNAIATSDVTGWVKDGSGVTNFWGPTVHGPADCVHMEHYGNFHWTPLNTYYHTLYDGQNGEGGGLAYCDHAFNGAIVWKVIGNCSVNSVP